MLFGGERMKRRITVRTWCGLALLLLVGMVWALMPILVPPRGLHSTGWNARDLIVHRTFLRLVDPGRIGGQGSDDEVLFRWTVAEFAARALTTIAAGSIAVGVALWRRHRERTANQASEVKARKIAEPQR
jgi:hypothetical protein